MCDEDDESPEVTIFISLLILIIVESFRLAVIIRSADFTLSVLLFALVTFSLLLSAILSCCRRPSFSSKLALSTATARFVFPFLTYAVDHSGRTHLLNNVRAHSLLVFLDVVCRGGIPLLRIVTIDSFWIDRVERNLTTLSTSLDYKSPTSTEFAFALLLSTILGGSAHLILSKHRQVGAKGASGLCAAFFGLLIRDIPSGIGFFAFLVFCAYAFYHLISDRNGDDSHEIHFAGLVAGFVIQGDLSQQLLISVGLLFGMLLLEGVLQQLCFFDEQELLPTRVENRGIAGVDSIALF